MTTANRQSSNGGVITYEEYHPYGTTAWWAEKSGIQVSRKRYRYTGKEKDEETGLYYHGARYYAAWGSSGNKLFNLPTHAVRDQRVVPVAVERMPT